MLKPEETPISQPPAPAPAEKPIVQTPTTTSGSFDTLKKTWSGSLICKILVVGVAFLLLLFFILVIVFGSKSSCTSYKEQIIKDEKSMKDLNTTIAGIKKDIDNCNERRNECNGKEKTCQTTLTSCQGDVKTCGENLKKAQEEYQACKTEQQKCNDDVIICQKEGEDLKTKIRQKQEEIVHWKDEVSKINSSVHNLTTKLSYFKWGALGGGVAVLIETIDLIYEASRNGKLATDITVKSLHLKECQGRLPPLEKEIAALKASLDKIKGEIDHCGELLTNCKHEIANERIIQDQLKEEIKSLKWQIEPIPKLAVDQAKLQLIKEIENYEVDHILLHNGTDKGYHKNDLYRDLADKRPLVYIARTDTGYVFGAATNISWPQKNNDYARDPLAYTFSTTRDLICPVLNADQAVFNTDDNFLQFGNKEIMVDKGDVMHPSGEATADMTYNCSFPDKENFYHGGKYFTIKDLFIYQIILTKKSAKQKY